MKKKITCFFFNVLIIISLVSIYFFPSFLLGQSAYPPERPGEIGKTLLLIFVMLLSITIMILIYFFLKKKLPKWTYGDFAIRRNAIRKETNQESLTWVAKNDENYRVRKAAVKKLGDRNLLSDIAANDKNEDVRDAAEVRLEELKKK